MLKQPDRERVDPRVWKIAIVVFLGPLMAQMDSTVVNFSLSTIRDDLHSSIESAQWIVSGYLLALALVLPLNGWLVDRLGAKRLFLGCFSAFTLASVLCGFARSMDQLIAARIMQGIVGGLLAPMTQMMLARAAGRQLARVMGFTAIPVLFAPLLGPIMAGLILKHASWPWLFYINLPIGLLAIFLAIRLLPPDEAAVLKRPFDFLGFLLISPGLACMLYGLDHVYGPDQAARRDGLLVLILGFVLSVAFFLHAGRKKSTALIDLRLFRIPVFATASATQFLSQVSMYAGQLLIPVFLIMGRGFSPTSAGWLLVPMGAGMLCSLPSMGFATGRFGCRRVSCGGALLVFFSTLPILWMSTHEFSIPVMLVCLFMRGAGQGGIGVPSLSAAYAAVPQERLALASTATNIVQRLGAPIGSTGISIVMAVAANHLPRSAPLAGLSSLHMFMVAFSALAVAQGLVVAAASRLPLRIHAVSTAAEAVDA